MSAHAIRCRAQHSEEVFTYTVWRGIREHNRSRPPLCLCKELVTSQANRLPTISFGAPPAEIIRKQMTHTHATSVGQRHGAWLERKAAQMPCEVQTCPNMRLIRRLGTTTWMAHLFQHVSFSHFGPMLIHNQPRSLWSISCIAGLYGCKKKLESVISRLCFHVRSVPSTKHMF